MTRAFWLATVLNAVEFIRSMCWRPWSISSNPLCPRNTRNTLKPKPRLDCAIESRSWDEFSRILLLDPTPVMGLEWFSEVISEG